MSGLNGKRTWGVVEQYWVYQQGTKLAVAEQYWGYQLPERRMNVSAVE